MNDFGVLTFTSWIADAGPWFTATAVVLTAALAVGVVAIVAVFGVREFTDKKGAFATTALRVGVPVNRSLVLGFGALLAVLFALGRWDVIPELRGSLPALSKSSV